MVVFKGSSAFEDHDPSCSINLPRTIVQEAADQVFCVVGIWPQREIFGVDGTFQPGFREWRALIGGAPLITNQGDLAFIAQLPELVGYRAARVTGANDDCV
ncbi:hypothetical protein D3C85_1296790 [compost metagenome]